MNKNEKYFVSLISSHLNNIPPAEPVSIDWEEIYNLSSIHNICAVITNQILMLPADKQPPKETLSKFRQQLGYTLIDSEGKESILKFLRKFFTKSKTEFLPIKGAVLRDYYPVKEFRTSGDIDIIVKYEDFDRCRRLLKENHIDMADDGKDGLAFDIEDQYIELHSTLDYDNPFFKNIFSMCEKNGYEYKISDELHLLYILCHIIKHFNLCGAGIKMFTDVDVLIRHMPDFNYDAFMKKCAMLNIETFAKSCFSLCNYWFDTPIKAEIDFNSNADFRELFENEIISSGSFGYNKRDLGDYYINKGIGDSGKNNAAAKIRAFFALLFPSKRYLANKHKYVEKYPFLLPVAWLSRLFSAVFIRTEHSKNTVKSIMNTGDESAQYRKLLNELGI